MGNTEAQKTFVEDVLQLQGKLDLILKSAFFTQVLTVQQLLKFCFYFSISVFTFSLRTGVAVVYMKIFFR